MAHSLRNPGVGRTHYSCHCGPFESRALRQSSCCWVPS